MFVLFVRRKIGENSELKVDSAELEIFAKSCIKTRLHVRNKKPY